MSYQQLPSNCPFCGKVRHPSHIRQCPNNPERRGQREGLNWREKQIIALLIRGKVNKEIAQILGLEYQTVRNTLARAYKILGVTHSRELFPIIEYVRAEVLEGTKD